MDALTQGKLDVRLGKETFSVQISRATNSMAEPSLETKPIMECNTPGVNLNANLVLNH